MVVIQNTAERDVTAEKGDVICKQKGLYLILFMQLSFYGIYKRNISLADLIDLTGLIIFVAAILLLSTLLSSLNTAAITISLIPNGVGK